jgi:hypothetical protein
MLLRIPVGLDSPMPSHGPEDTPKPNQDPVDARATAHYPPDPPYWQWSIFRAMAWMRGVERMA